MKRAPSTSPEFAVQAAVDAAKGPPKPPKHTQLRDGDWPFWDDLVRARSYGDWKPEDLPYLAQLARCQHDIEAESVSLDTEGSILENFRGTMVMNPRVSVLEQLTRRQTALARHLRMGGRVSGDARDDASRSLAQRQADKVRGELEEEELLAS